MTSRDTARLTNIFRTLFNQPELQLRDDLTARDVPTWDSLNHVNLMMYVEEEFGVRFSTGEVSSMQNVGDLKRLIDAKAVTKQAA
ncbi:MAG: acyl carrier protein [Planctomycetaceae bacterium]|nr:acyl carrier protein [Planctomycetaceae bacterium]